MKKERRIPMIVHTFIYADDQHTKEIPMIYKMTGDVFYKLLKEYEDFKTEKDKLNILNALGKILIAKHNIHKDIAISIVRLIHLCYLYGFVRVDDTYMWNLVKSIRPKVDDNLHDIPVSLTNNLNISVEEKLQTIIDTYSPISTTNPLTPLNTIDCLCEIVFVLNT